MSERKLIDAEAAIDLLQWRGSQAPARGYGGTMNISIMLRTADFRGDHAADCLRALEPIAGETVDALIKRAIGRNSYVNANAEVIELRVITEAP